MRVTPRGDKEMETVLGGRRRNEKGREQDKGMGRNINEEDGEIY